MNHRGKLECRLKQKLLLRKICLCSIRMLFCPSVGQLVVQLRFDLLVGVTSSLGLIPLSGEATDISLSWYIMVCLSAQALFASLLMLGLLGVATASEEQVTKPLVSSAHVRLPIKGAAKAQYRWEVESMLGSLNIHSSEACGLHSCSELLSRSIACNLVSHAQAVRHFQEGAAEALAH